MELPPRTRRILTTPDSKLGGYGTTSAYAENTEKLRIISRLGRNYLRVRGEYWSGGELAPEAVELPPRTRRIPKQAAKALENMGNYLRVRGEYPK